MWCKSGAHPVLVLFMAVAVSSHMVSTVCCSCGWLPGQVRIAHVLKNATSC